MIDWLNNVVKGQNRHLSAFYPAIAFGYIYTKGYARTLCEYRPLGQDVWLYTGLPSVVYLGGAVLALIIGSMTFVIAEEGLYKNDGLIVDISTYSQGSLSLLAIISLSVRVCLGDLILNALLFVKATMWLTQLFHSILVRKPWKNGP
jgi:hypothetical protein